jgi:hypothetical protein
MIHMPGFCPGEGVHIVPAKPYLRSTFPAFAVVALIDDQTFIKGQWWGFGRAISRW